jgi:hypothetical protein
VVEAHGVGDLGDVGVQSFTEFRELVGVGDLEGQERVAGVLGELCAGGAGGDDGSGQGLVELGDGVGGGRVGGAEDDAVGVQEVVDRVTFA